MLRRQLLLSRRIAAQPFFSPTGTSSFSQTRSSGLNVSNLLQIIRNASSKRAAATAPRSPPKPASVLRLNKDSPPPTLAAERFRRFEYELSKLGGSATVFKAPAHGGYIAGTYIIASFCFFYTGYNFYATSINPLVELAPWHKYLFAGICLGMGAMGTVILKRGSRLIASITAIAPSASNRQTKLVFKIRRMAPFLKQKTIETTPEQIALSRSLRGFADEGANTARLLQQQRMSPENEIARAPFYRMPLKKFSYWAWRHMMSARRIISQDYFIFVKIDGHKEAFRMDTLGTYSKQYFHLENAVLT